MPIRGEKFGELCEAANETVFSEPGKIRQKGGYQNMVTEASHVAAVAVTLSSASCANASDVPTMEPLAVEPNGFSLKKCDKR